MAMGKTLTTFYMNNLGDDIFNVLVNTENPTRELLDERLGQEMILQIPENHIKKDMLIVDINEARSAGYFEQESQEAKDFFESQNVHVMQLTKKGKEYIYPLFLILTKERLQAAMDMVDSIDLAEEPVIEEAVEA